MCGIAGLVMKPGRRVEDARLRAMTDAIRHRGPDDAGFFVGKGALSHVGLGHRRLSILDLAGGHQPMASSDARIQVVFNGEIYDFQAQRKALADLGHVFSTDHSDTEVLVHGYRQWGADLPKKLLGMYAFAALDQERRTLLLARDPMGKKPLYIATRAFFDDDAGVEFAFGSELAALAALPGAKKVVDARALARYFAFDFVPDPDCIYEGVFKLPPSSFVEVDLNAIGDLQAGAAHYRDLSFGTEVLPKTPAERHELLRSRIRDAVQARLVADVPVGVFLSGGIDSSTVAALAAQGGAKLRTFSVAFTEKSFDESSHARLVAQRVGAEHHEEVLDAAALTDVLPTIADHLSEPFADHSVIPTYLLSRFTRQSVTVALGGDGGDELFLGYPTFVAEKLRPRALDMVGAAMKPGVDVALKLARLLPVSHSNLSLDFKLKQFLGGISEPRPLRRHQKFLTGMDHAGAVALLSPDARRDVEAVTPDVMDLLDVLERAAQARGARDVFDTLTYGYAKTYLAAGVMQKVDRATMAVSLEARAPLLDQRVVDLALSFTTDEKLAGFTTKAVLKEAVRGLLPDSIIDRPKKGFGMPVASWLLGPLRPMVEELFAPKALQDDGLLDPIAVRRVVDEHLARKANHRKTLWALFMYRWWRVRVHGAAAQRASGAAA